MIKLKNISKSYQTNKKIYTILEDITFSIEKGEFVLIMGKSGSGKSTILNLLTGIDRPSSGEIIIGDDTILNFNEDQMARWRGNNIGIVFQFFQLIPTLSVLENILLPMDLMNKIPTKNRKEKALELLQIVDMYNQYHKMPNVLSGGEQQRIAIARALANDVDIIVLDEPTGNLDSKNADDIFILLDKLKHNGKTIVMVTHEREIIKGASRKILIHDGKIIEDIYLEKEVKSI